MVIKKCSFILIALLLPFSSFAERARILTPDNGLSNSHISQIYQDSKGYIWIATENGLNKFDGYSFTVYSERKNDSTSLKGNYVYTVLEDSRGIFWVGTMSGLFQYDRTTDSFHPVRIESETPFYMDRVIWMLEDKKGNIWLSYPGNGIICLDANTLKPTIFNNSNSKIADNNINCAYEDAFGKLWLGTYGKGIYVLDTKNKSVNHYSNDPADPSGLNNNTAFAICEDSWGRLLVGTLGGGVNVFDRTTKTFKQIMAGKSQTENQIFSMCIDKSGNCWLGTDGAGIIRYDENGNKLPELDYVSNVYDLSKAKVHNIFEDKQGNMWVDLYQKGILFIPATGQMFKNYGFNPFRPTQSIGINCVISVLEDSSGDIWVGTDGDGVYRINYLNKNISHFSVTTQPQIPGNVITALFEDKDKNIWFGTYVNGMFMYNRKTNQFEPPIPFDHVTTFVQDKNGVLWIGTNGSGIYRLDAENKKAVKQYMYKGDQDWNNQLASNWIYDMIIDASGKIWVGTSNGVSLLDHGKEVFTNFFLTENRQNSNLIYTLNEDHAGNIWVGSFFGLYRIEAETREIKHFTTSEGLPDNMINGIVEDENHLLWLSTGKGLCRFNPETGDILNLYVEDGIQSNEFRRGSYFKGKKDRLYFGGINGLTTFYPSDLTYKNTLLGLAFSHLLIYNTPVMVGKKGVLTKTLDESESIRLKYNQRDFTFTFAALEYGMPQRVQYYTLMENFSDQWRLANSRGRSVTYTNLNPGNYVFKVKATLDGNHFLERRIQVIIDPPFWLSIWAKMIYLFLLLAILYAIYAYLARKIKQNKRTHSILIVADDTAIQNNIRSEFASKYIIYSANNEKEGLNYALKFLPDVIISDILMPEMDGLALCRMLKTNSKTNYIPIILLTSKTSIEKQIDGLETGADSYITKPFNLKHLEIQIDKLIRHRTTLKTKISEIREEVRNEPVIISPDERLFRKFNEKLKEQIGNPDLSVASISKDLGVSRIHLNRRLKSIINESPGVYIRNYRLKQAAALLSKQKVSIAEVAYAVGFSSHAYFSNLFKEYYGVSPTEYMEANVDSFT